MTSRTLKTFSAFERIFVVTVLLLGTGALLSFSRVGISNVGDIDFAQGDPVTQLLWTVVYVVTVILALTQWRRITYIVMRDKLLLLLVGVAVTSVLWSAEPGLTLRRSITLAATTLFGTYVAARYTTSELLRLLAWALGIAALLSLIVALALPAYGISVDPRGEAWRGIFWYKNALGGNMALSALAFLCVALGCQTRRCRWLAWGGVGLSTVLLVLSESITALVAFVVVLTLYPISRALRWRRTLVVPVYIMGVLACGCVAALLLTSSEGVLAALGRDPTLTGRTELWSAVLEMIRQRPWLGYGFQAFWLGWMGESSHVLLWMAGTEGNYSYAAADNGYLELALSLGLLGVSLYLFAFLRTFFRAVRWARITKTAEGLWPLMLLTFLLIYNLSESVILAHNSVLWILYVAAQLSTVPQASKAHSRAYVGVIPSRGLARTN